MKLNCWEVMQCGRQPGGHKVDEFGVCPASTEDRLDNINGGKNGGRSCWAMPLTLCREIAVGEFVEQFAVCIHCEFYAMVRDEEGLDFALPGEIMERIGWRIPSLPQKEVVLQKEQSY